MSEHRDIPESAATWHPNPEERARVFSPRSFPAVERFARRFIRLVVPTGKEGIKAYEEQFGSPPGKIDQKELDTIASIKELAGCISEQNAKIIRKELGEVLAGAETTQDSRPTRGATALWKGKDRHVILDVVADGVFDDFPEDRKAITDTILGLSAVVERAGAESMARSLEALPAETLGRFGMTETQREIVTDLVRTTSKTNPEYLRHRTHTEKGRPYDDTATDAFREWNVISRRLAAIAETLTAEGPRHNPVFGIAEDAALAEYLTALRNAYAVDADNARSVEEHEKRMKEATEKFFALHTKFPALPLIVFPAMSHYMTDAAPAAEKTDWKKYGFDPELRLYWQSPEQVQQQQRYAALRDSFADSIDADHPKDADTTGVRRMRVIEAQPLTASGTNILDLTIAQSEKNLILMADAEPDEDEKTNLAAFRNYCSDTRDIAICDSPAFFGLWKTAIVLHELGHGLYAEDGREAEALGADADRIAELKSDIAMWVTAARSLNAEAEKAFGSDGIRALNLAMIFDGVKNYRTMESKGEDLPYFLSAHRILSTLKTAGIITAGKRPQLHTERLDEDLGTLFSEDLKTILATYKDAADTEKTKEVKAAAKRIAEIPPGEIMKELRA